MRPKINKIDKKNLIIWLFWDFNFYICVIIPPLSELSEGYTWNSQNSGCFTNQNPLDSSKNSNYVYVGLIGIKHFVSFLVISLDYRVSGRKLWKVISFWEREGWIFLMFKTRFHILQTWAFYDISSFFDFQIFFLYQKFFLKKTNL